MEEKCRLGYGAELYNERAVLEQKPQPDLLKKRFLFSLIFLTFMIVKDIMKENGNGDPTLGEIFSSMFKSKKKKPISQQRRMFELMSKFEDLIMKYEWHKSKVIVQKISRLRARSAADGCPFCSMNIFLFFHFSVYLYSS